ncbi:hypothetical protein ABT256_05480 [Amycolatopsis japonica]
MKKNGAAGLPQQKAVRAAILTIQQIVRRKCGQIPDIGTALDNTRG